ncbi:MAG: hypothetical protein H7226_04210 [Salinibacterium sp.]|nr:hypothetical protein [Salinibacterium sp.]
MPSIVQGPVSPVGFQCAAHEPLQSVLNTVGSNWAREIAAKSAARSVAATPPLEHSHGEYRRLGD